ncbi:2,3-dihydroxybenzoate decarboxylase [Noviherbaspirillum humi]|uniref:2,3-dihydroxybenzoate decarboxylase n=1 Tax=Noviherbaspirillum humi TaxID=1688639 RepID=A0A239G6F8_9BURK|nr:amidohydrolase family protein [Noviherbaspirillum humi]SNS64671.1 2,3-dihydroxybenzoate decarboxylase [Noviherbaspirillum humi]
MSQADTTAAARPAKVDYKRIATEEAFAPPDLFDMYRKLLDDGFDDPGFRSLWGFHLSSAAPRVQHIMKYNQDLGELRLRHMDEAGIDMQVLSLTSPGVQVFDAATAVSYAQYANDYLAEAVRRHPTRFAGLTAIAPQDPQAAAKEIERGATRLGMKGIIVNSHTKGEYLSDQKYWDIFAAAEAHDMPIYLHPSSPPAKMIEPFMEVGLDGAVYGFGVETGLSALRIMTSGALDRFPKVQIILGHMGEALPYWAYRLDYMHRVTVAANRYDNLKPTKRKPSEYLKENFYVTNSGVAWEPAIKFAQDFMGVDRVMYAMDYPYQHVLEEVVTLDNMDMSADVKKRFFQTNAERVFKLA